jgi:pyruvate kinase
MIDYTKRFKRTDYVIQSNIDAVSHATCSMAIDTEAKGIVISSLSGSTVRMVSRFRCPVDIIGMTTSERAWRKLNLSWGVTPVLSEEFNSVDVMFYHAIRHAKNVLQLEKGDNVILTGGQTSGISGNTNTIRLETV